MQYLFNPIYIMHNMAAVRTAAVQGTFMLSRKLFGMREMVDEACALTERVLRHCIIASRALVAELLFHETLP